MFALWRRSMIAWTLSVFVLLPLLFWLFGLFYLWNFQERFLYFPKPVDAVNRVELAAHELSFTGDDGVKIAGWLIPKEGAERGVFYLGGNALDISDSLIELRDRMDGHAVAGFNYRGFGDSGGKPAADDLRADALAGFATAVAASGIPAENWLVIGRSLGTNMAALVAADNDVGGLVLVTPYDSIAEVAARLYWMYPVRKMLRHQFNTVPFTADVTAPTLVFFAEHDYTVPHASTQRLLDQWQGTGDVSTALVAGAWHGDIVGHEGYWRSLLEFSGRL